VFFYLFFPSVFFNHYRFWLPFCIFKLLLTPSSKSDIDKHSLINQINALLNRVKPKDGILHVFNGILCNVSAYTNTVSFCRSTYIRYQKSVITSMTKVYLTSFSSTKNHTITGQKIYELVHAIFITIVISDIC
jgi:hypothetical protein